MDILSNNLEIEILKTTKKFFYVDFEGLSGVIKNYSRVTIQRSARELEIKGLLVSKRNTNNKKIFTLSLEGEKVIEKLLNNYNGIPEMEYRLGVLKWLNYCEGNFETIENELSSLEALAEDEEGNLCGLVMQREKGKNGIKNIFERLLQIKEEVNSKDNNLKTNLKEIYIKIQEEEFENAINKFLNTYFEESNIKVRLIENEIVG